MNQIQNLLRGKEGKKILFQKIQKAGSKSDLNQRNAPGKKEVDENAVNNLSKLEENSTCVDCATPGTKWVSLNIGVWICNKCSDVHREVLGKILSDTKSLDIGTLTFWTPEQIMYLQMMGNKKANEKFEHNVTSIYVKPNADSDFQLRVEWLTAKYLNVEFMKPIKGYLYVRIFMRKKSKWERVWCHLRPETLDIYEQEDSRDKLDEIDLKDATVHFEIEKWEATPISKDAKINAGICFQICTKDERSFVFNASTHEEYEDWVSTTKFLITRRRALAQKESQSAQAQTNINKTTSTPPVATNTQPVAGGGGGAASTTLTSSPASNNNSSVASSDVLGSSDQGSDLLVDDEDPEGIERGRKSAVNAAPRPKKNLRELLVKRTEEKESERAQHKEQLAIIMEQLEKAREDKTALQKKLEDLEKICSQGQSEQQSIQLRLCQLEPESQLNFKQIKEDSNIIGIGLVLSKDDHLVEGGTITKLVEMLTYEILLDTEYLNAFMLTYRSFTTSSDLLNKLVQRFQISTPPYLEEEDIKRFTEMKQKPIRLRVFNVLKHWLTHQFYDFELDSNLVLQLISFLDDVLEPAGMNQSSETLRNILRKQIKGNKLKQAIPVGPSVIAQNATLPGANESLKWEEMDPKELAKQFCLIEHELFKAIKPPEFLNSAWENTSLSNTSAPNILALTRRVSLVSSWVTTVILRVENLKDRVKKIEKFINLAHNLKELHNYNGVQEILGGLTPQAVTRLKKTWDLLNLESKTKEKFESMKVLMNPDNLYENLYAALPKERTTAIPYIDMYLKKLKVIEDENPELLPNTSLVNFAKRRKIANVIREIQQLQQVSYPFQPNEAAISFLTTGLQGLDDVQAFNCLSHLIEPKENKEKEDQKK